MLSCCNHLLPSAFDNLLTSGCLGHGGGGEGGGGGGGWGGGGLPCHSSEF